MVSVPKIDCPHSDQSAAAGTSDTESNSGRDNEVSVCIRVCPCACACTYVDNLVSLHYQDVFYTEAEMERRRLSSASSTSLWAPTPDWVGVFARVLDGV